MKVWNFLKEICVFIFLFLFVFQQQSISAKEPEYVLKELDRGNKKIMGEKKFMNLVAHKGYYMALRKGMIKRLKDEYKDIKAVISIETDFNTLVDGGYGWVIIFMGASKNVILHTKIEDLSIHTYEISNAQFESINKKVKSFFRERPKKEVLGDENSINFSIMTYFNDNWDMKQILLYDISSNFVKSFFYSNNRETLSKLTPEYKFVIDLKNEIRYYKNPTTKKIYYFYYIFGIILALSFVFKKRIFHYLCRTSGSPIVRSIVKNLGGQVLK